MPGDVTSIYSTSRITDQFKRRLAVARERNEDVRRLTLSYFRLQDGIFFLDAASKGSVDKQLIRNVEKTLEAEVADLFPEELFPKAKVKPWWRFW